MWLFFPSTACSQYTNKTCEECLKKVSVSSRKTNLFPLFKWTCCVNLPKVHSFAKQLKRSVLAFWSGEQPLCQLTSKGAASAKHLWWGGLVFKCWIQTLGNGSWKTLPSPPGSDDLCHIPCLDDLLFPTSILGDCLESCFSFLSLCGCWLNCLTSPVGWVDWENRSQSEDMLEIACLL